MSNFISLWQAAVTFGTVILFGALGELITEKSGNLNLGTPGIMYLGGIASLIGAFFYENGNPNPSPVVGILIALICAIIASALGGLLYSFLTITLRANQNVTGLTLTIFGSGVANFFGGSLNTSWPAAWARSQRGHHLQRLPGHHPRPAATLERRGPAAVQLWLPGLSGHRAGHAGLRLFLNRTRAGLNLRAVGENPATADAAGINVTALQVPGHLRGRRHLRPGRRCTTPWTTSRAPGPTTAPSRAWAGWPWRWSSSPRWRPPERHLGQPTCSASSIWLFFYIRGLTRYSQELFKMLPYVVTIIVLVCHQYAQEKREYLRQRWA